MGKASWWQKVVAPLSSRYMENEDKNYENAWMFAQAGPQERALMAQQAEAFMQSLADRRATRNLILGQMGLKVGKDAKGNDTLIPLTREERLAMMSEAQKSRSSAAEAYDQRAQAALTGKTKLPSFLKSNIDYQKEKESALLHEMLGANADQSTAVQQAVAEMRKKEEDIRQQLQDQDIAITPQLAQGIRGQLAGEAANKIANYENLPRQQEGILQTRGAMLNDLQGERLDAYKYRLGQLESKRNAYKSNMTGLMSMFGAYGGAAAGAWGSASKGKGDRNIQVKSVNYQPNTNYYDTGMLGRLSYGNNTQF